MSKQEEMPLPPLIYQETFDLFSPEATAFYTAQSRHVFRAFIDIKPSPSDILPPRRKKIAGMGQEYKLDLTPEDVEGLSEKEEREEIEHDGISVFNNENQVVAKAKQKYRRLLRQTSKEEADHYMKTQYGTYIGAFNIEEKHGLMSSKFHSGHGNLFLREGVTVDMIVDPNYEIKPFAYDD